ncbi:hypothetical protein [Litoreibacter janthinus]|uniref:Uncharacterized protein n=1 Tax=Litoreibacter janthinus TaxID=670154 RepID=A0A1I6FXT7_9RHOB|nr:hypothetical protein [Litoreibacter janthinus]SFR34647.1 hypothetical protein SAMN04488002_0513 [Litoreibacter janthinus]
MKPLCVLAVIGSLAACNPAAPTAPSGSDIPWPEAVELFQSCKVDSLFQLHDKTVTLNLKDGRTLTTTAPYLDAMLYDDVMPPRCGDVGVIME